MIVFPFNCFLKPQEQNKYPVNVVDFKAELYERLTGRSLTYRVIEEMLYENQSGTMINTADKYFAMSDQERNVSVMRALNTHMELDYGEAWTGAIDHSMFKTVELETSTGPAKEKMHIADYIRIESITATTSGDIVV